jgi:hypothetical protein
MFLNPPRAQERLYRHGFTENAIERWLDLYQRTRFARKHLCDSRGRPWTARDYQAASLNSYA